MGLLSAYFNYKASVNQAQTDAENAQLQYDAAMKQIEAQKEANSKQQQFNKEEAELAFSRNSSKGQLQQLMAAGLSEQQARQIIAGGSAGSYTAAPSVNQNQGVDYTAPAAAQAAANQAQTNKENAQIGLASDIINFGTIGAIDEIFTDNRTKYFDSSLGISANVLQSSLTSSNGGIIGALSSGKLQSSILQHINDIPASARGSYAAFCAYASSAAAPAWCKTADFQNFMQSASSNPLGVKAMREFFDTSNQLLTGEQHWQALATDVILKQQQERLNTVTEAYKKRSIDLLSAQINTQDAEASLLIQKIESEKLAQREIMASCISQELQNQLFKDTLPVVRDSTIAELTALTNEMVLKGKWFEDDYNSQIYLNTLTATEEGKLCAAMLSSMNDENTKTLIEEHPGLAWLVEIHNALKGSGLQVVNSAAGATGAAGLLIKALKYVPK